MLPPLPKTQAEADKEEERILEDFERAEKMANEPNFVNPTMNFQDPLTSMHYNESLENDSDLGPLKPAPPDLVKDIPQYKRRLSKVKLNEYKKCIRQFTFEMLPQSARGKETKKRGQQLTLLDHDRIKALMYEFCVRGLLPHIEKQMRSLSEQVRHLSFQQCSVMKFLLNMQVEDSTVSIKVSRLRERPSSKY